MLLITFVSVFLLVNNVRSGLILNDANVNVTRVVRDAYKYNHPPPAEYISVPVAVLYEEHEKKGKSIEDSVSTLKPDLTTSIDNKITTQKPDEDSNNNNNLEDKSTESPVTISEIENITEKVEILTSTPGEIDLITTAPETNHKNEGEIFMPRDGLIIPVAVVYDVEPEHLKRTHKKPRVSVKAKPVTRQQRHKNTNKESEVDSKNNEVIPKKNNLAESIRTGIFPKRSEEKDPVIPIVQSESYVFSHSGNFHYSYEGGDGTRAFERGGLVKNGKASGEAVEGSFSYIGKDGKDYSLTYTADENGYRPVGDHLPTPPPIPPAIARALKYLATKPTPESITENYY